jgi:hypothetical protein
MGRAHFVTYNGQTRSESDWAAQRGLDLRTLNFRLNHHWPIEKALNTPANAHRLQAPVCRWCPVHECAWLEPIDGPGHWHPLPRRVLADAIRWAQMGGCAAQIQVQEVPCGACAPALAQHGS